MVNGYRIALLLAGLLATANSAANCGFDADSADRLDFADQIVGCEPEPAAAPPTPAVPVELLYEEAAGSVGPSVIREHKVVAPGSLNHTPGAHYETREPYSLRADAAFEESVTFAIQRLHVQMAHHCSDGWVVDSQRSEPKRTLSDPLRAGKYYLYYRFSCAAR